MPKTKVAFAFAGFDENRILKRKYFKTLADMRRGQGIHWTRCDTDSEKLSACQEIFQQYISDNQYGWANGVRVILKEYADSLNDYFKRVENHLRRLAKLATSLKEKFLTDESIDPKLARAKMLRVNAFEVEYKVDGDYIKELAEQFDSMAQDMEYQSNGRYRLTLTARLREARLNSKLTQANMASRLGLTPPAYTRYESGANEPPLVTLAKISNILDVTTDWLLGLE